jgi:hypothetical protein
LLKGLISHDLRPTSADFQTAARHQMEEVKDHLGICRFALRRSLRSSVPGNDESFADAIDATFSLWDTSTSREPR